MSSYLPLNDMSLAEKLQAMEEIWNDLAGASSAISSPEWHADILRTRELRITAGEADFVEIAAAKQMVRELIK
ncbi:MAG: addiction module protein [Desulfuromonadaceae bacterium]|nr:addiction module protein [Desulfuromonas sp.]MDY0185589.1 addiction module protein [Desulfuromonadaceae bacterium]